MTRKIAYWSSTAIVAVALLSALTYLTGSEQVVSGFAKAGRAAVALERKPPKPKSRSSC